ncbi:MAG TPA: ABC transporter substrate binding protein, partial [Pyrinomonadaceae bacterium]|nr:ABC transporter substrate binding protein [Pyrinomonadaceae bacterium]
MERALRSTLKNGSSAPLEIYSEYSRNKLAGPDYEKELLALLQKKYEGKKFDVIFSIGSYAISMSLKNSAELFADTPIVFLTIDRRNIANLYPAPGVTGVWGEINFKPNLELALALHPGTKRAAIIQGVSEIDKFWATKAKEDFREYQSRLEFIDLAGLTIPDMRNALAGLPPDTIVFFVSHIQDKVGNAYESPDYLRQVSPASAAPIYGTTDAHLGVGAVGGSVLSFEALGGEAGRVGLRVLAGERPEAITAHGVPSVVIFDWRELKRWGISEQQLPRGSVVRFKVPSFWERYKWYIIGTFTLLVLQTSLIAVLLFERRRRRRAKEALDRLNAELEERIAARTAALADKSKELETFAYSVAHDLKAPLRGINGYTRLLIEDFSKDLNGEAQTFLKTIQSSSEEMNELIDDLLAYSHIERREFKSDRIDLQPLVSAVVEQKSRELTGGNIEFISNINGISIVADANGLVQSLRNYIDNAVKFSARVSRPRIEIGCNETVQDVVLWVRDNGIGFNMKYHDQIFGIFERLNRGEEYPGTGIGLAIVRKAMERMGGRAWAESEPGHGATFYLEIP